ncbi:MAG: tetratricopeptide repeat protein, partial [Pseudolabrys sp.]
VVDAPPVAPQVQPPQPAPQADAPKRPPMPGVKRPAIDPNLPPDQPIEPGSMPPRATADLAARIAASEAALGPANPAAGNQSGEKLSFIAAARRAAQAAALEAPVRDEPANLGQESGPSFGAKLARRVKKLFVAASVIAITIGSLEIASRYYDFGASRDANTSSARLSNTDKANVDDVATTGTIGAEKKSAATPMTMFPTLDAQTANVITTPSFTNPPPIAPTTPLAPKDADVTNSIPQAMLSGRPIVPAIPMPPAVHGVTGAAGDKLPAALGGSALRTAALGGNPAAAYEVGVRYAEGRGVTANLDEAARWFERAASRGLAPAQFRLASLLEKGQGVKKDLARARKLYLSAASKGNAKAMHNLAVLYAEGADGKPDYAAAAQWFLKAANRGVADSQYNLAILYARGLGVEKSFADSYKWFALAAIQGDRESGKKRDDIGSRLDAKTLAAAQHAVKIWTAEPQPEEATGVPHPPGGWDQANPAPPAPAKHRPRGPGAFEIGKR